jgi:hypothetical protein
MALRRRYSARSPGGPMKFTGNGFSILISALTIGFTVPGLALGASTCDQLCSATKDSVKSLVSDPKCKSSADCLDCVATSVLGSQQGAQCDGYKSAKKSSTTQVVSASLYTATGIACGIACAVTMIPAYGNSQASTMTKLCGGLGLATAATDVAFALTSNDIAGGLMGAVGGIGTAKSNLGYMGKGIEQLRFSATDVTEGVKGAVEGKLTEAGKQAKSYVCINTAIYLGTGVLKTLSVAKMKKSSATSCGIVESLASTANGPVQACLASAGAANPTSTTLSGMFSLTTTNTFPTVSTDDVNRQEIVSGKTGDFMRDMKADLDAASAAGKIDLNDIAKRIDNGESVSAIAAGAGLPSEITDPLKEFEEKAAKGGRSPYLASLSGGNTGGYTSGSGRLNASAGGSAYDELSFGGGSTASPGEGADTLEIERKPSSNAVVGASDEGDVFHESFGGTIFDIVTYRLKEQKGNYAELVPEGRMNRLFNGYSDPKKAR